MKNFALERPFSDVYDIVLKDAKAIHPALTLFSKAKENIELLGQYDGQPNKFNEKILSLDVEKLLYYVGLGMSRPYVTH